MVSVSGRVSDLATARVSEEEEKGKVRRRGKKKKN
jgi:hypothetical protein